MYADVNEAIVGVLRASGVAGIDWTKSPYYIEAAEPLPGAEGSAITDPGPFPYVVYELPESSTQHTMGDAYVETYKPRFYVVGTQKDRAVLLSPYAESGVIAYLDSLRGTAALPAGYKLFDGANFDCIQFTRDGTYLAKDSSRGTFGERVWLREAGYTMIFNLG